MAPQIRKDHINLLSEEYRQPKNYKFLTRLSVGVLSVYLFVLLLLGGVLFFFFTQKSSLAQKNNQLIAQVQNEKETESMLVTLKNRVSVAQVIFGKSAPSPTDLVTTITSLFPQDVTLSSIDVDKDGKITLVAKSAKSSAVSTLLNKLKDNQLNSVMLNTLALGSDGNYVLSLNLVP